MPCPICETVGADVQPRPNDRSRIDCPRCGPFEISRTALEEFPATVRPAERWKISAWLQDNSDELLTTHSVREALQAAVPSQVHRADRMLRWLAKSVPPGRYFTIEGLGMRPTNSPWVLSMRSFMVPLPIQRVIPIGWNEDNAEACFMVSDLLCHELGYLSCNESLFQVTPKGRRYLEGAADKPSSIGFCAMWFDATMRPLYDEVLVPTIRECGFEPVRVDGPEHNGRIDDEIVAWIRRSKFVVADFTGHRGGVYYEAGLAHGLGIPVIFTCRSDELRNLHFDVRQYNTIDWDNTDREGFGRRLRNRILATIGQGPLAPPTR